jgi:hypothetical protein
VKLLIAMALLAVILAGGTLLSGPPARAGSTASRIVDRTFACETGYLGGVYQATVQSYWSVPPQVTRRTPSATVVTNLTDGFLGGISSSSIYVTRVHCKATSAELPLTTKGLRGGSFSPLGTEYKCYTPRRVLLRIRAEFVRPTPLRAASRFGFPQLQALGATTRAELAVATLAGKPLAYASVAGAKKTRLLTSSDCQED